MGTKTWSKPIQKQWNKPKWLNPSWSNQNQHIKRQQKGKGGGWGKSNGKGNLKGKIGANIKDTSKVVWVGGLPSNASYMELKIFGEKGGAAKWAEVKKGGTGCIGYGSPEEAAAAVPCLSGKLFKGSIISCDLWESK